MKVFSRTCKRNVGDTLTPILLRHFLPGRSLEIVEEGPGKLVGVGSILSRLEAGDVSWGAGAMYQDEILPCADQVHFLAARGQLTRSIIQRSGGQCPDVTGDPGLLVSRLVPPAKAKRFKVGYIPHYVDYPAIGRDFGWNADECLIDVFQPLEDFVEKVTSCERIISSSLHGIVIAESYGIPCEWVKWSDGVYGGGFKFRDYLTGTGRPEQGPGSFPPIEDLEGIQDRLIDALMSSDFQVTPRHLDAASYRCSAS